MDRQELARALIQQMSAEEAAKNPRAGMGYSRTAARLGLATSTVAEIAKGLKAAGEDTRRAIARAFPAHGGALLGIGDANEPPPKSEPEPPPKLPERVPPIQLTSAAQRVLAAAQRGLVAYLLQHPDCDAAEATEALRWGVLFDDRSGDEHPPQWWCEALPTWIEQRRRDLARAKIAR